MTQLNPPVTDEPRRSAAGSSALEEMIATNEASERDWQRRMLPLMAQVVLGLAVFFFVVSLIQLTYLHMRIREAPTLDLSVAFTELTNDTDLTFDQRYRVTRLRVLAGLDAATMQRRYHQVNASLMARVWTRYMGFVTGMILSVMGALFILGKLRDKNVEQEPAGKTRIVIGAISPGLVITLLGMVLMMTAIIVSHRIETSDVPGFVRYLDDGAAGSLDGPPATPPPDQIPDLPPQ